MQGCRLSYFRCTSRHLRLDLFTKSVSDGISFGRDANSLTRAKIGAGMGNRFLLSPCAHPDIQFMTCTNTSAQKGQQSHSQCDKNRPEEHNPARAKERQVPSKQLALPHLT